jgi:glucokinase
MILVGDIGGTKTVLALVRPTGSGRDTVRETVFASREHGRFDDLLSMFLKDETERPAAICLGVAGPVLEGRCRTTNLPWMLDERDLGRALGVQAVKLLNDVEAAAFGVLGLRDDEVVTLNPGRRSVGNVAVIAAGTGLGEATLAWDGRRHVPVPSEGGHTDFAPRTDREIELLRFLRAEFGRVSYERVISGPGQYNIYRFLRDTGRIDEPDWLRDELAAGDPSAVISRVGLAKRHPICVEAVDLFASVYGAEAGNLALKSFAVGGVFVAGGIAPKMIDKLRDGVFMTAFSDKGRYRSFMESIPVKVSLNPRTPLLGAARYAIERLLPAHAA